MVVEVFVVVLIVVVDDGLVVVVEWLVCVVCVLV